MIMATAFSESSVFIPQSSPQKSSQTKDTTITEKSVKTLVDGFSKSIDNLTRKLDSLGKVIDKLSENVKTNTNTVKDNTETNNTINKAKSKEAALATRRGSIVVDDRDDKTRNRDAKAYNDFINNRSKEVNNAINNILKDTSKNTNAAYSDELRNAITDYLVTNGETSLEDALRKVKGINKNDISKIKRIADSRRAKVKGLDNRSILSSALYADYDHLTEANRNELLDYMDSYSKNRKDRDELKNKYDSLSDKEKKEQKEKFEQQMALLEKEGENLAQQGENLETRMKLQPGDLKIMAEEAEQRLKDEREKIKGDVETAEANRKKKHYGSSAYDVGYALGEDGGILGFLGKIWDTLKSIAGYFIGGKFFKEIASSLLGKISSKIPGPIKNVAGKAFNVAKKVASKVALPLAAGYTAYEGISGAMDDEAIMARKGYSDPSEITAADRAEFGGANAISGLTLGLVDKDTVLNAGDKVDNYFRSRRNAKENAKNDADFQKFYQEQLALKRAREANSPVNKPVVTNDLANAYQESSSSEPTTESSTITYSGPKKPLTQEEIYSILDNPNYSEKRKRSLIQMNGTNYDREVYNRKKQQNLPSTPDVSNIVAHESEKESTSKALQQNNNTNNNTTVTNYTRAPIQEQQTTALAAGT